MQGRKANRLSHSLAPSLENRQEQFTLHTRTRLAWMRNIRFLQHPRADPGVNLNFKQNRVFPWSILPVSIWLYGKIITSSYFKMPDTQVGLPWKMNRALVLNFTLISLSLRITGILLCYSRQWWQMTQTPCRKAELACSRTSEIRSGKLLQEAG